MFSISTLTRRLPCPARKRRLKKLPRLVKRRSALSAIADKRRRSQDDQASTIAFCATKTHRRLVNSSVSSPPMFRAAPRSVDEYPNILSNQKFYLQQSNRAYRKDGGAVFLFHLLHPLFIRHCHIFKTFLIRCNHFLAMNH